ncbi:MAG: polyprenyl synthetase family protein [Myxococcota bacterium]
MQTPISVVQLNPQGLASNTGLTEVEAAMVQLANGSDPHWTGRMARQHLASGGKRVRARLALAAGEAVGVSRGRMVPWAAAVELLHNATLAHDDIQDGDWLRRGEPTLWVRYGLGQAINIGDLMLMLPTLAVERLDTDPGTRWALARAIADRSAETVRGQSLEMSLMDRGGLDWDSYLTAVRGKTGQLLALPVEGAMLMAGHDPQTAAKVAEAFIDLGVLFQLQDDVEDLYPDDKERVRGTDLREGKITALVVSHLQMFPESPWLLDLLRSPAAHIDEEAINRAIETLLSSGSVKKVIDMIENLGQQLVDSPVLSEFPRLHGVAIELSHWIAKRATQRTAS